MSTSRNRMPEQRRGPVAHGRGLPLPGRPASAASRVLCVLLLLALPAVLFALITWQVVAHGPLLRVDERLSRFLVHPDRPSELLADLGNAQVAVPVLALVLGHTARRGRAAGVHRWWLPPAAAAALMALVPVLVVPLKEWTARHGTAVMPPGVGYYPSGHTATAAVAYGSAALLLLPWLRRAAARRLLVAVFAVLVLGVGFGLVRRGYHWPLDVVASWCLCAVLLTALRLLLGGGARRPSAGPPPSRTDPG